MVHDIDQYLIIMTYIISINDYWIKAPDKGLFIQRLILEYEIYLYTSVSVHIYKSNWE